MSLEGKTKATQKLRGKINRLEIWRGYSAYEVAVNNGFEGTEEEWLASLQGRGISDIRMEDGGDKFILHFDFTDGETNSLSFHKFASESGYFLVTVTKNENEIYTADKTFDELVSAKNEGKILLCWYYDEDIYLPLTMFHGLFVFSGVVDNCIYQINIASMERITITKTDIPHDLEGYATEKYVDDAIANIDLSFGDMQRIEVSDSEVVIEPNQLYVFPEMASLSITFGGEADSGAVQEYQFRFISGAVATTLILPEAVKGDITVDANSVVEVSVVDNYAISQSWAVG